METMTDPTTINPECTVCNGTGEDAAFGGKCSMCWYDSRTNRSFDPALVGAQEQDSFSRFRENGNQHSRANNMQTAQRPSDPQITLIRKLDPSAEIPSNRKMASVLIEKLLGKSEAPGATDTAPEAPKAAQARWTRVGDHWLVKITGMVVHEGDTIAVTKANGEVKSVTLGTRYIGQDDLWNTAAPKTEPARTDVPEGRYAITSKGHNDLMFVKVDRPTSGKWAGYRFVKMIVGGHNDTPIRGGQAVDVLARIVEAGVTESMMLYGQELGQCGHCGRTLTDDESRARGIGPTCILKY